MDDEKGTCSPQTAASNYALARRLRRWKTALQQGNLTSAEQHFIELNLPDLHQDATSERRTAERARKRSDLLVVLRSIKADAGAKLLTEQEQDHADEERENEQDKHVEGEEEEDDDCMDDEDSDEACDLDASDDMSVLDVIKGVSDDVPLNAAAGQLGRFASSGKLHPVSSTGLDTSGLGCFA